MLWRYARKHLELEKNRAAFLSWSKGWRKANPDKAKAATLRWRARNAERINRVRRERYGKRADAIQKRNARWMAENPEKAKAIRAKRGKNYSDKRRNTPALKIKDALAERIRSTLKGCGQSKSERTATLVGCTMPALVKHLEKQFQKGMSWTNYGSRWHVDHRIPCADFNLLDPQQQRLCFHWSNLQPMFAIENMSKGRKITQEHQFPLLI